MGKHFYLLLTKYYNKIFFLQANRVSYEEKKHFEKKLVRLFQPGIRT